jgi:hypothetical protein
MTRAPVYNHNATGRSKDNLKTARRQIETAQYVADMLLEMRHLARSHGLITLQGLLEITYYEAFNAANPVVVSPEEHARLHELGADVRRTETA